MWYVYIYVRSAKLQQTTVFDRSKLKNQIVEKNTETGRRRRRRRAPLRSPPASPVFPHAIGNNPLLTRASNHPHCSRILPGFPDLPTQLSPGNRKATIKGKFAWFVWFVWFSSYCLCFAFSFFFCVFLLAESRIQGLCQSGFAESSCKNCFFMPKSARVFVILCNCTSSAYQFVSQFQFSASRSAGDMF